MAATAIIIAALVLLAGECVAWFPAIVLARCICLHTMAPGEAP